MKQFFFFLLCAAACSASAQMPCFEFRNSGTYTDWRDTSCIACTSDPGILTIIQNELAVPFPQRSKHIAGVIAAGDAGVNHNAGHWFRWHFVPGQWGMPESSIELCDGRPFSDVDADTAYWLHQVGAFCPWSFRVSRPLNTTGIGELGERETAVLLFPNPATDHVFLLFAAAFDGQARLCDLSGRVVQQQHFRMAKGMRYWLDLDPVPAGIYVLELGEEGKGSIRLRLQVLR